jgi:hypothetical protein
MPRASLRKLRDGLDDFAGRVAAIEGAGQARGIVQSFIARHRVGKDSRQ